MKLLRIFVLVLFVITSALSGWIYFNEVIVADETVPVIKITENIIDVGIDATEEELLKGVTAYDGKDKDLTHKVIVESISKFLTKGVCKVTYAVCDSDNHVSKASRKIRYTDYYSPKFKMARSTCYSIYEKVNILDVITAEDCIDGDVSRNIVVTSDNYTNLVAGVYSMNVTVTNSKGDVSELSLPLILEDRDLGAPQIELKDYLIYVKIGSRISFADYVVSAVGRGEVDYKANVRIQTDNVDLNKKGTYSVHYYATDETGLTGHTVLTVVVG